MIFYSSQCGRDHGEAIYSSLEIAIIHTKFSSFQMFSNLFTEQLTFNELSTLKNAITLKILLSPSSFGEISTKPKLLLEEAGFSKTLGYWEGEEEPDEDGDVGGDGEFYPTEEAEQCEAWVTYIAATK